MRSVFLATVFLCLAGTASNAAGTLPTFKSTCVKVTAGELDRVCIASNGKTLSSRYVYRNTPTTGTHTGCTLQGDTIRCSSGQWKNSFGTGPQPPISVKLSNGKPISAAAN